MSRRIDVELTSARDDGTWTWRAAGAKQPKGVLDGALLYEGAKMGDVVRAEVETDLDGTRVLLVIPPKSGRREPERLTILGRGEPEELVTSTLVGRKGRSDRGDRGDRGDRPDRGGQGRDRRPGGPRSDRPGGPRSDRPGEDRGSRPRPGSEGRDRSSSTGGPGGRSDADKRERRPRPERPAPEPRPRAKRLRPGRAHRKTVLDGLPPEQQPIAEHVLRGGIPAVRQAVEKQNDAAKAEGRPTVPADALVAMAEKLLPALRAAEWLDRAEAALKDLDELDLRDLRSVVAAADTATKDDESRALASQLRDGLTKRVEQEQAAWMAELSSTLGEGRVVRALRLSSRPPKAGVRLPPDLTTRLTEATAAALTNETPQDRWATVLDALSFSPIHLAVIPPSVPASPNDELVSAVRKFGDRLPQIAALFGIEAAPASPPGRRPPRGRGKGGGGQAGRPPKAQGPMSGGRPVPPPPSAPSPSGAPAAAEGSASEPPAAAPAAEAPASANPAAATTQAETPVVQDAAPTPEPAPPAAAPEAPIEHTPALVEDVVAQARPTPVAQTAPVGPVESVEEVGSITPPAEPTPRPTNEEGTDR